MNNAKLLRNLPAVDEVLRRPELDATARAVSRRQLTKWIRAAIDECRQSILDGQALTEESAASFVIDRTLGHFAQEMSRQQQPVINATGILLHTNLGRAPLARRAIERMQQTAGYTNVELDLNAGKRSRRADRACELLCQLTGAESALIVNNCAAATMLVLQTVAAGREVVVSRGQLVEIGGGFRLPEVFAASGAVLREVGTTNRTYLKDYEQALTENTAAIIRVHRSNFYQGGFVTEPDISDLVSLGREHNVPVIDDVGSGCVSDLSSYGLNEPSVTLSIQQGADLTLFSGDKLFGGPQAGIIAGRNHWVSKCARNPMMRALRVDKVTIAAIEATAEIHLADTAESELPLMQMLSRRATDIRSACEQLHAQLEVPPSMRVTVCECTSQIGGGSVPGSALASHAIRIAGGDSEEIARKLRQSTPAVLGRISEDAVLLDLRTVPEERMTDLRVVLQNALHRDGT